MPTPNLRYALRSLAKSPVFTVVAALSLALALAVNTTMFALVDAVLNPAVPYHDGGRVHRFAIRRRETRRRTKSDSRQWSAAFVLWTRPYSLSHDRQYSARQHDPGHLVANTPPALFDVPACTRNGRAFNESDTRPGALPS